MKYKIWYWYTYGKALYTEYFKSEFTYDEAKEIVKKLRQRYKSVEMEAIK